MWNVDLINPEYDAFGNLMSREWVDGVEFTHFNIYPRGQQGAKCMMIPLRDVNKVSCFAFAVLNSCYLSCHLGWVSPVLSEFV